MRQLVVVLFYIIPVFSESVIVITIPRNNSALWIIGFDDSLSFSDTLRIAAGSHFATCMKRISLDSIKKSSYIFYIFDEHTYELGLDTNNEVRLVNTTSIDTNCSYQTYQNYFKTFDKSTISLSNYNKLILLNKKMYGISVDWLLVADNTFFYSEKSRKITIPTSLQTNDFVIKVRDPSDPLVLIIYTDRIIYFSGTGTIFKNTRKISLPTRQIKGKTHGTSQKTRSFSKETIKRN